MGFSESVLLLKNANPEFATTLKQVIDDSLKSAQQELTDFETGTKMYYKSKEWDFTRWAEGSPQDFQLLSEISLDQISQEIKRNVINAFGAGTPITNSVISSKTKIPKSILEKYESPAFTGVTALICNILTLATIEALQFKIPRSTQVKKDADIPYKSRVDRKPLAPGLTLHLYSLSIQYGNSQFFDGETILMNSFVYELFYSSKEIDAIATDLIINEYRMIITETRDTKVKLQNRYRDMLKIPGVTQKQLDTIKYNIDLLISQIKELRNNIQLLVAEKNQNP